MAEPYRSKTPCPICGGYGGAYRKADRCHGFISDHGSVYCSQVESGVGREIENPWGLVLHYHGAEVDLEGERGRYSNPAIDRDYSAAPTPIEQPGRLPTRAERRVRNLRLKWYARR